jgi:hypothetical protein
MRILILDFNDNFFPIYERKLKVIKNIEILYAKDIEEAIKLLENNPDCILMNHLFFKKYNYYDRLRLQGFTGDIIITIPGKEKIIKRSHYNGISGIIDKSLNGDDFIKSFYSILNKHMDEKSL